MIDSGATEDFIDQEVCNNHRINMIKAKSPREICLADGKPSAMSPVTHMTKVPVDISSHREWATFQVANLQNDEIILGMPWLRQDNPRIEGKEKESHSTANDVRLGVSNVRPLQMLYRKKKPRRESQHQILQCPGQEGPDGQ